MVQPKVFISYSWSSKTHQEHIKNIVERLAADGVESVVDIYDLKEGDDKYHYMERMVQDESVTHVLVICDKKYSEKANSRKDGVGTESIIISQEIYSSVSQSKFIPLIFEHDDNGDAYTPIFLKTRIYIDFSTLEKENENWERLIRLLYGKPEFTKPKLGTAPAYLNQDTSKPSYEIHAKLQSLKSAVTNQRPNVFECRQQFLQTCREYCDSLRVRTKPCNDDFAEVILQTHKELIPVRDSLVEWVLLEGNNSTNEFEATLRSTVEMLIELSSRPADVNHWSDNWFHAHEIFSYETFLYIVAALIKTEAFSILHEILNSSYLKPSHLAQKGSEFCDFSRLYANSDYLQNKLSPENMRLYSPVAELIKLSATRSDILFNDLKQADLVLFMMSLLKLEIHWYPQMLLYSGHYESYPLFVRAIQHRGFKDIAVITGIDDSKKLTERLINGANLKNIDTWKHFRFAESFLEMMNVERMNTIK